MFPNKRKCEVHSAVSAFCRQNGIFFLVVEFSVESKGRSNASGCYGKAALSLD
jgi:hypothetical protein